MSAVSSPTDDRGSADAPCVHEDEVVHLVMTLEHMWLSDRDASLDQWVALLEERQGLLHRLLKIDTSHLDESCRRDLGARIARVKERDAELSLTLAKLLANARKEADTLVRARFAVRGYRAASGR